jgi:hypothetical protein
MGSAGLARHWMAGGAAPAGCLACCRVHEHTNRTVSKLLFESHRPIKSISARRAYRQGFIANVPRAGEGVK